MDNTKYILEQLLEIVDKQAVDAVLIAGDVYDRTVPSEDEAGVVSCNILPFPVSSQSGFKSGNVSHIFDKTSL